MELANDRGFAKLLRAKHQQRMVDEAAKPLESYRQEELEHMRLNFFGFDSSYHVARYNFVHRLPRSRTPLHLATHRARTLSERTPASTESVRVKKALIDDRESA